MSTRKKNKNNPAAHQLQDLLAVKAEEAKSACEKILKRLPNLVFANNAMGLATLHLKDFKTAEVYLRRALDADPQNCEYMTSLGNAVLGLERVDEAISLFNQALAIDPNHKPAHAGMANALIEKADPDAAIAFFQDTVNRMPGLPGPLSHLGKAYIDAKRYKEAVNTLFKSIELQINFAPAHVHLGMAFREMGMLDEALECHKTAILLDKDDIFTNIQMAETLNKRHEYHEATKYFERLIEIAPTDPNSYTKLAVHLSDQLDRYQDAMALLDKASELNPNYALIQNNIGAIKHDNGDIEGALKHLNRALELAPDYLTAQHNLSLTQLQIGNLKEGWANHESRLRVKERKHVYTLIHRLFDVIPKWDGKSSLQGKSILLMHEQGYGDSIQFARYVHLLLAEGAKVYLNAKEPLAHLFSSLSEQVTIVRESDPLPKCDYAYVLMSLPYALGTDSIDKIPSYPAYLSVSQLDKDVWAAKIAEKTPPDTKLRVGIIWAGNAEHGNDRRRSVPLDALTPLLTIPNVQIFSLQKGDAPVNNLKKSAFADKIVDLGSYFRDFTDTAAAIEAMDIMISVDTSVAHLSGALGKRTWTMLAHVADWRWFLDREDTPWYPNMRLFRQKQAGNWSEVVTRIQQEIIQLRDQA
jgi:tetratricopeptide (TPR) repeat protein